MKLHAVIPTYNAPPERLARAVESTLLCESVEAVWVVDDGSVAPVAVTGALADSRVRVIEQANAGPSSARNTGLDRAADADAVVFLDDDDELLPDGVAAMLDLGQRLGAGAVVAAREQIDARSGHAESRPVPEAWADRPLPRPGDVFEPISLFGASGCMVLKPALRVRFDTDLWIGEDRDFLRRCAALAPVAVCSTPAVRITIHADGSNLSGDRHFERRVRDHLILLERHYEPEHDAQWRQSTLWLVNQIAKRGGADPSELLAVCAQRGWKPAFKTRWRLSRRRAHA